MAMIGTSFDSPDSLRRRWSSWARPLTQWLHHDSNLTWPFDTWSSTSSFRTVIQRWTLPELKRKHNAVILCDIDIPSSKVDIHIRYIRSMWYNVDVAGLSIGEILNGHLDKCPFTQFITCDIVQLFRFRVFQRLFISGKSFKTYVFGFAFDFRSFTFISCTFNCLMTRHEGRRQNIVCAHLLFNLCPKWTLNDMCQGVEN